MFPDVPNTSCIKIDKFVIFCAVAYRQRAKDFDYADEI